MVMPGTDPIDINRESNEVVTAVNGVRDAIAQSNARHGVFNITAVAQQTHVRIRANRLIFSVAAAGTITFTFGGQTYAYEVGVGGPLIFDLPAPVTIIDRGTDIFVTVAAAALRIAYLTYLPE